MSKLKSCLIALGLLGGGNSVIAQTDVTATYIQNPSFELASEGTALTEVQKKSNAALTMFGWTESGQGSQFSDTQIMDASTTNASQYGTKVTPSDGTYYFFVRQGWTKSTAIKITSNEMSLPAGTYKLSVNYKQAYGYDNDGQKNSNTKTSLAFAANGSDVAVTTSGAASGNPGGTYFQTAAWSTLTTSFTLADATTGNIEVRFAIAGAKRSDFCIDNVRLIYSLANKAALETTVAKAERYNAVLSNDAITQEITTANTILADADATQETVDAEVVAINSAIATAWAAISSNIDATSIFIDNPSFETGSLSPWTANSANDTGVRANSNATYSISNADGNYIFNTWGGSAEKYVKQTLTELPEGYYKVTALVASDAGKVITVYAGDKTVAATASPDGKSVGVDYSTPKVYVSDGSLEIGATSTDWYKADNFRLTYYTEIGAAQDDLIILIAETQAMIDGGLYKGTETLQAVINEAKGKTTSEDKTEIEAAMASINTAITNLKISNASLEVPYEMTVKNADMATTSDWTGADLFAHPTNNENPGSNVTRPYFETWVAAPGTQSTARKFYQTIANCPQGVYELKAAVTATYQVANSNVNENTGVYLYIKDGETVTRTACKSGNAAQYFSVIINHEADGDLEIGLEMESATRVNWVAFDNFSLTCYGIGNYDALAQRNYDSALTAARAKSNDKVTGYETTDLATSIATTPSTTADYISQALDLQVKTINFTEAEEAYNNLATLKSEAAPIVGTLQYATETSKTNLENALVTSNAVSPTSAADAAKAIDDITSKRRAYYESNGKAEGVEGAVDCTASVVNADFSDELNGWDSSQGGGTLGAPDGQTWTNADGSAGGHYYDYWNGTANNQHGSQTVTGLKPGKYIVTLKARAQSDFCLYLMINGNKVVDINEIGNTDGVFGNGWNDYTAEFIVDKEGSVKIEVANTPSSNQAGWFGFGDVRLVRLALTLDESTDNTITNGLANVILKRTIVADVWNTLVLPFDMTNDEVLSVFGADAQVAAFSNTNGENVNFDTTTEGITANVPVLLKAAAGTEYTFNGYTLVEGNPVAEGTMYDFVGNYSAKYNLADGEYMLSGSKFWKNDGAKNYHVKGFRAYLSPKTPEAAAKSLNLVIDGTTTGLKLNTVTGEVEGESYNLAGQRVADSYKGLVIKNGKKVIRR